MEKVNYKRELKELYGGRVGKPVTVENGTTVLDCRSVLEAPLVPGPPSCLLAIRQLTWPAL